MAEREPESGEKEFEASEQKLQKAREEGNIVRSKEVYAFALILGMLVAAGVWSAFAGKAVFERLSGMLYHADVLSRDALTPQGGRLESLLLEIGLHVLPLVLVLLAATIAALVFTRGVTFSARKVTPDVSKLSIFDNLKKKYGAEGLFEFLKDTVKLLFAAVIAGVFLYQFVLDYYGSAAIRQGDFAAFTFAHTIRLIVAFAVFQCVLAMIDFPLQRLLHAQRLRMTREELKKDTRQSEGDPHFKQARRSKAARISSGKMLQSVKTATVVMVNPEHYAVALLWDPDSRKAPVCVAKGVDHLAARIREVATAHKVPIYRDPPSTRSIYALVDIDEEIRPEHFAAVAAAIQFVDRARPANRHA